jgi:cyanophycinase
MSYSENKAGAVALVGSGEFLEVMNETDSFLLQTLGGADKALVAVIPTASGLEPGSPQRWAELGLGHFHSLGASVEAAMILSRQDTADPAILELLRRANFFYFSGGNPNYLVETMQGTTAWDIITQAHARGAVLAGCSAGAMAFGGHTIGIRAMMSGQAPQWVEALGLLPGVVTFPHFDRMAGFVSPSVLKTIFSSAPSHAGKSATLIGVDEDTALVRLRPASDLNDPEPRWQVMGRQTVSVFGPDGKATIYKKGDKVFLNEMVILS